MHKLRTLIVSANYLFTFEAAARRLSFTEAANELNVTQPAVSKSIRALENACGVELFYRHNTRLALTSEGQKLYEQTLQSLDGLYDVISSFRSAHLSGTVRVSFSSSFTTLWLLPRLKSFKDRWPEITLRIAESDRDEFDLDREEIDISSRLGYGKWDNVNAYPFLREEIIPVCSKEYLQNNGSINSVEDLLSHSLLHVEDKYRKRIDWESWFHEQGVAAKKISRIMVFTDFSAATQAALLGQGIALGWTSVLSNYLSSGQLLRPIQNTVKTDKVMYLITSAKRPMSQATRCFLDWMLEEVKNSSPDLIP